MNERIKWDDLYLFLAVAQHGGLSGASQDTGLSGPTLGRRMLALERATAQSLFDRHAKGYDLTDDGRALLARARAIATQMDQLVPRQQVQTVKISAGVWTTKALCHHAARLADPALTLRFVAADHVLDILHREVVIGIRNQRPDQSGLAAQRVGAVDFAIYGAAQPWARVVGRTPSARWVAAQSGPGVEVTHPSNALDLVRAGVARAVLPTFVGDMHPDLLRQGDTIAELRHDQWLVSHEADRHLPEVRHCLDRISALLKDVGRQTPMS